MYIAWKASQRLQQRSVSSNEGSEWISGTFIFHFKIRHFSRSIHFSLPPKFIGQFLKGKVKENAVIKISRNENWIDLEKRRISKSEKKWRRKLLKLFFFTYLKSLKTLHSLPRNIRKVFWIRPNFPNCTRSNGIPSLGFLWVGLEFIQQGIQTSNQGA